MGSPPICARSAISTRLKAISRSHRRFTIATNAAWSTPTPRAITTAPKPPTKSWDWDAALDDLDAGRAALAGAGRIGLVGFCWGGSLAWLAACRRSFACAVAYYGSAMPDFANEQARCPVIAHIGDQDTSLPPAQVERFRTAQPGVPVHIYEGAQHGFDNEQRAERYHPAACRLARERTLEFLARHVG